MPYVFQAETICDECRANLKGLTKPEGPGPYDSDDYPSFFEGGEMDSPCHCGDCGAPIDCTLTEYGVKCVLESIRESLADATTHGRATTWDRIMPKPGTGEADKRYWFGSRHVEIVRGWTELIRDYNLERDESAIVDLFLELSEPLARS